MEHNDLRTKRNAHKLSSHLRIAEPFPKEFLFLPSMTSFLYLLLHAMNIYSQICSYFLITCKHIVYFADKMVFLELLPNFIFYQKERQHQLLPQISDTTRTLDSNQFLMDFGILVVIPSHSSEKYIL